MEGLKYGFSVFMAIYGLYYALMTPYESRLYGAVHLGFAVALYSLVKLEESDSLLTKVVDAVFFVGIFIATVYVLSNFNELASTRAMIGYTTVDILVAAIVFVAITEYTRREYGNVLLGVILVAVGYGLLGTQIPGFFGHSGLSMERTLEIGVLNFTGAYGRLTVIAALWIYIFIIWAGLLRGFNEIQSLLDVAYILSKRFKSGIYQMAVTASMFVGAVVGTPAGNVVISGNFTIPMMMDRGIDKDRAAAIESVASTGGMVLPPIMGSAAFIMASLLGMSYTEVIIHATLVAVLLYALIMVAVHFSVLRDQMIERRDASEEELQELEEQAENESFDREINRVDLMKAIVPMVVGLIALVIALAYFRYSPTLAGLYTLGFYLGTKILIAIGYREFYPIDFTKQTVSGLAQGSIMMAPITIILASMGAVVTVFSSTGLPVKIAVQGTALTGGILIAVLLVVAAVTIIFGMGMPISAAYLLAVSLLAPMMLELGIPELIAHFFVLYWAMVAAITPPVALACAIATNISGGDFLRTVKESLQIGVPYFVLPFLFITRPELILYDGTATAISAVFVIVGMLFLMSGVQRIFDSFYINVAATVGGLAILFPTQVLALVPIA
ncbi:TRAP transporter fused permease subunit [Natronorubrum sp. JWXQ-INN-674]|uniref:TRAP transporter fused permease subunit n=1 Tax=Natronorubrum halalkaliphilum TaxID=2691917 RepID=A0A6B0VN36_9EURY|nr:TRAP transporter fused permease subunit [Natronorubrum halalkaliphilum]MXV63010.1 TRAP transporter fused permease subunit [Natronorubrum halalkaliphilum]